MIYFVVIYSIIKLYVILDIYQQAHYYIKDYFRYFLINFIFYSLCPLIACISGIVFNNLVAAIISGAYIILYSLTYFILKVKLKISKRIMRLFTISIIFIISISFIPHIELVLILIEFSIIPILYLEKLISYLFNKKYIKSAINKLDNYNKNIIAITGSYGKTSVKNLFYQCLNIYSKAIKTPKSYNTVLGISKFINDEYINLYDNLILEFGASKCNDIKELSNLFKPDVAVVTEIGYMHMNGFKSLENVIKEKMSIINDCNIAILNYDNEYIRNYKVLDKIVLSYGLYFGDYNAKNINKGSFDFYYKNNFICHFDTNLSSRHQIINLLAPLSYIHYLKYDLSKLNNALKILENEKNRFQIKQIGNRVIIDDSFNSNLSGFISALRYLGECRETKILITPGIVELGRYKRKIYSDLIEHIAANTDIIILVGIRECRMLYEMLKQYNKEVYVVRSYIEGYSLYSEMIKSIEDSALLIENDLPDIYQRGWLL